MDNENLKSRYNDVYRQGYENHTSCETDEEAEVILEMVDWKDKQVLEIGCGEGDLSAKIESLGATSVCACDYSPVAIKIAKQKHKESGVGFYVGDIEDVYCKYDVIVMQGVMEHLDDPYDSIYKLLTKNLRNGGCMVTSSPCFCNPRGLVLMTIQELFGIKTSLTDLWEIHPWQMGDFCDIHDFDLFIADSNYSWGNGDECIKDFNKRLKSDTFKPLVRDATGQNWTDGRIDCFLDWLKEAMYHIGGFGGNIIYRITK